MCQEHPELVERDSTPTVVGVNLSNDMPEERHIDVDEQPI